MIARMTAVSNRFQRAERAADERRRHDADVPAQERQEFVDSAGAEAVAVRVLRLLDMFEPILGDGAEGGVAGDRLGQFVLHRQEVELLLRRVLEIPESLGGLFDLLVGRPLRWIVLGRGLGGEKECVNR